MLEQLLTNPFLYTLSLTLLHFLWQGLVVAMVLKSALLIIDKSKSRLRYALSGMAMLANLLLAVSTFVYIFPSETESFTNNIVPIPLTSLVNELTQQSSLITYQELLPSILAYSLPYIALLWLIAIAILASKLLIEIHNVNSLPKHAQILPSPELLRRFKELAKQIKLSKTPKLLISLKVDVPMAIGWLKPVVLLPASMVTGLSPAQLDMLLLHELAHIRRYDYIVNFLQTLVELLFFFHPSVAWVGKQIRNEREYCSDDIAVQHCGDPIAYAHTLADTASLCAQGHLHTIPSMAMAASGGDLKERVLRLVDHHCAPNNSASKWYSAISIMLAIILILGNQLINNKLVNNTLPNQWHSSDQVTTSINYSDTVNNSVVENNQPSNILLNKQPVYNVLESDLQVSSIAQHLLEPEKTQTRNIKLTEKPEQSIIAAPLNISDSEVKQTPNIALNENHISHDSLSNASIINKDITLKEKKVHDVTSVGVDKGNTAINPTTSIVKLEMAKLEVVTNQQKAEISQPNTSVLNAVNKEVQKPLTLIAQQPNSDANNKLLPVALATSLSSTKTSREFKATNAIKETLARTTRTIQTLNKQAAYNKTHPNDFTTALKDPYQQHLLTLSSRNEKYLPITEPDNIQTQKTSEVIWHNAKQLTTVDPVYPSLAKRKGIEIEIQVEFTIDQYGEVKDITFAEQSRVNYFKSAIRAAIRKWRFIPAKKNEQAIESQMSKIFSFSLQA